MRMKNMDLLKLVFVDNEGKETHSLSIKIQGKQEELVQIQKKIMELI